MRPHARPSAGFSANCFQDGFSLFFTRCQTCCRETCGKVSPHVGDPSRRTTPHRIRPHPWSVPYVAAGPRAVVELRRHRHVPRPGSWQKVMILLLWWWWWRRRRRLVDSSIRRHRHHHRRRRRRHHHHQQEHHQHQHQHHHDNGQEVITMTRGLSWWWHSWHASTSQQKNWNCCPWTATLRGNKAIPTRFIKIVQGTPFPTANMNPLCSAKLPIVPSFPSPDNLQVLPHKYDRDPQSFRAFCNTGPNHPRRFSPTKTTVKEWKEAS